ncbi:hypothetical protein [Megasphaera sp.]|uniref:hypothetical protein n=1 Tax=Megasphaera sp. TaxID=2023260 RepID=UPI003AB56610
MLTAADLSLRIRLKTEHIMLTAAVLSLRIRLKTEHIMLTAAVLSPLGIRRKG